MTLRLRPGTVDDAEPCAAICYTAFETISGRHGFPKDFPSVEEAHGLMSFMLARDDIYAVVAEADDRVVGSNFLWETSPITGVGPITVDPAAQDGSVGRRLMEDVLQRARDRHAPGVRLVQAAYHGRSLSLYAKLGFDPREPLATMQGNPVRVTIPAHDVRPATEGDVAACNALHHRLHGFERERDLRDAIAQNSAKVVEHDSRITGYATSIGFFGHAVGESTQDLKALIAAAPAFAGPGFLLPIRNAELFRWCLAHELRIVQTMTLMSLGLYNEPRGAFLPSILF